MDNLLERTQTLLAKRGENTLVSIAYEADVGYEWLSSFNRGLIDDPGVRKVQALHDHLVALKVDQLVNSES